jgi:L-iditol 2-dehydrogenase
MKSAITLAPHNVEIQETAEPTAAPGKALIRVERVGICGSDVHLYHGAHPHASYPLIQGHEASGKNVAFGE